MWPLFVLSVIAVFGYAVYKEWPMLRGGAVPGIPTVGVVHTIAIDQSTAPGSMGQLAIGPADSVIFQAYTPPAGYQWVFTASGSVAVQSSGTSATFTLQQGAAGSGTASASLVKAGDGTAPVATYTMALNEAVY